MMGRVCELLPGSAGRNFQRSTDHVPTSCRQRVSPVFVFGVDVILFGWPIDPRCGHGPGGVGIRPNNHWSVDAAVQCGQPADIHARQTEGVLPGETSAVN